jgi:hypothetical protein
MRKAFQFQAFWFTTCLCVCAGSTHVTINNLRLWRDVSNMIMDAHDGNIRLFKNSFNESRYYMYAMGYGNYSEHNPPCNGKEGQGNATGFRSDHNISVWSSADLSSGSWRLETREALPIVNRPLGIYFRPKVVFNKRSRQYVLWVNYMEYPAPYQFGYYLTATSATPEGPFKIANGNVSMTQPPGILCDFDLFVDDDPDQTAYLIYTVHMQYSIPRYFAVVTTLLICFGLILTDK